MFNPVDYNTERENNIIKNIAKEIVIECIQEGFEAPQELAHYLVKLKMLNPKSGFTASEVMPRSLTQQLVMSVVEELKQDTPAMNCIRLQVYWNSVNLNVAFLKKEYQAILTEKAEPYQQDLVILEREDVNKMTKLAASYILASQNLGIPGNYVSMKETMAAIHSVMKTRDISAFFSMTEDQKIEMLKTLAKKVTGIRVYLNSIGKANEEIDDVRNFQNVIEACKEEVQKYAEVVLMRVYNIREVISNVVVLDFFSMNGDDTAEVFLPADCDPSDLKYLKQILVIMLQHNFYLNDLYSKLEEIDGNFNIILKEYEHTLQKIQGTVRDREAVPTTEVYDDFIKVGELWLEIQCYFNTLEMVEETKKKLEQINKKDHFLETPLEKAINVTQRPDNHNNRSKSLESSKSMIPSSVLLLKDEEDFHLEFRGFCAWILYYGEGYLVSGIPQVGTFKHEGQYYSFSSKAAYENWAKNPNYYLMNIYEHLRHNPEMIELLNAYDQLYSVKDFQMTKKVDRKIATRTEEVQTVLHPVEKFWDKDYTFSQWELKKRALALSRLVKCVTKSAQTVDHSHYRSSIGILAAPDKDKEVQTKKDSSCVHPTIANYLYGLRGQREDKFKVIELTRPIEETCEREIILEKGDPCRDRRKQKPKARGAYAEFPCPPWRRPEDACKFFSDHTSQCSCEYNGEG